MFMSKNQCSRQRVFTMALALCASALAPASARASEGPIATTGGPDVPFKGCFYYEHANFQGQRRDIPFGLRRRYVGDNWNDSVSSIACSNGCALRVWEHRDFTGARKTFHGATIYVGDAWNDAVSSMEVVCR
jgi:hypothetical protein